MLGFAEELEQILEIPGVVIGKQVDNNVATL